MTKPILPEDQRIGITEAGEVSFNLDVFDRLYRGNVIITKRLTDALIAKLAEHQSKIILHLTVTGQGGGVLEKMVPTAEQTKAKFDKLIDAGFPISHVVLRIDPIVPTPVGLGKAMHVVELFKDSGIKRVRFSLLDMYNHVVKRFKEVGLPLPYQTFHAPLKDRTYVYNVLIEKGGEYGFDVEVCGEPGIASVPCLSQKDIDILGLTDEITLVGNAGQRRTCRCAGNKKERLTGKPHQCENACLYCFWKND